MNKKLYVGNLSYETTETDLQTMFSEIGPIVSAVVITDKMSGRSKGFGFVEMETEDGAREAIEKLNNKEVNQRTITVNEARPPRERSFGGGGNRGGRRGNYGGGRNSSRGGGNRDRY
jgi:RNA recognition motif-containing protein